MLKKKSILIYSNYYYPDVASTGQILQELAEGMLEKFDVTIISAVPSYTGTVEKEYQDKKYYFDDLNGVRIIRVRVPEFNKQNKSSRVRNIVAYFFRSVWATLKSGHQDYVFSISQPPILGGLLGVWGKWVKRAKYIYNIQDYNPEQIMVVGYSRNKMLLKLMMWLDKFSCRHSDLVVTVGRDLVETLEQRFNHHNTPRVMMINNWTDEKSIYPVPENHEKIVSFKSKYGLLNKFVIMYSGNIGLYYDLENIIKVIKKFPQGTKSFDGRDVIFAFVGEGALLPKLKKYVESNQMKNVRFIPYQPKSELVYSLNAADVHWCVNAKGIKGVSCPSKFYGIAAAGKPVLGVLERGSEVEMLIQEYKSGLLAEPEDYSKIEKNIETILSNQVNLNLMGKSNRELVETRLTKSISIQKYITAISSL